MITMALPVHPAKGYNLDLMCPVVVCDACQRIINADRPGWLLYDGDDFRLQFHAHKGRCIDAVETAVGRHLLSREMDEWLGQLALNYTDPLTRPRELTFSYGDTFRITSWSLMTGREGSRG